MTSGRAAATSAHSAGLSSANTNESRPSPSVAAISAICSDFGRQSATKAAKSSTFSRIAGLEANGSRAASRSFLDATARITPRRRARRVLLEGGVRLSVGAFADGDPVAGPPRRRPLPTACCRDRPPGIGRARPRSPASTAAVSRREQRQRLACRTAGAPRSHSRGSNHRCLPTRDAMRSVSTRRTSAPAASASRRLSSRTSDDAARRASRIERWPSGVSSGTTKACWMTRAPCSAVNQLPQRRPAGRGVCADERVGLLGELGQAEVGRGRREQHVGRLERRRAGRRPPSSSCSSWP